MIALIANIVSAQARAMGVLEAAPNISGEQARSLKIECERGFGGLVVKRRALFSLVGKRLGRFKSWTRFELATFRL
jgi:hypothetical protein